MCCSPQEYSSQQLSEVTLERAIVMVFELQVLLSVVSGILLILLGAQFLNSKTYTTLGLFVGQFGIFLWAVGQAVTM